MKLLAIFIFYLTTSMNSLLADDVERILTERAYAFSSHRITGRILESVNQPSMEAFRGQFIDPRTSATEQIPSSWINNTREYMEYVNNRASFSPQTLDAQDSNGPKRPNRVEYEEDMKRLDKKLTSELTQLGDEYKAKSHNYIKDIVEGDYAANRAIFEEKGLKNLFMDIFDFDEAPSRGKLRVIMEQIAKNQELVKQLPYKNIQGLVRMSTTGLSARNSVKEKIELEKSRKTKFFNELNTNYEASVTEKKLAPQRKLDSDFFEKKNLNSVSKFSELTDSELLMLKHHSGKPLKNSDPQRALDIVNENRRKARAFIEEVKGISNSMSSDVIDQKANSYSGKSSDEINRVYKDANAVKPADRYKTAVQVRMGATNSDLKAISVANKDSRLTLLDIVTKDSIEPGKNNNFTNPNKAFNSFQNVDIKKSLDKIPATDIEARRAFVRYVAEYGTPAQMRSVRIHAHTAVMSLEAMGKLKTGCGK